MPPKSKKKKSKVALEAEQKAQEEEKERLRVEEEEKEKELRLQRAEEEKQQRIHQKLQEQKFRENEEEMSKIKCDRHQRLSEEMKLIEGAREWRDFLACDNIFDSINDVPSLNCFLYENKIPAFDEEKISSKDLCKFGVDVSCIMTSLIIERLHLKSTSQLHHSLETKSRDFLSECLNLLQAKLNAVTVDFLKQKEKNLLTAERGTSCFGIELHETRQESDKLSSFLGRTILPIGQFGVFSRNGCVLRVLSIPFYQCHETYHKEGPLIIGNTLFQVDVLELPPEPTLVEQWVINSDQTCNDYVLNTSNTNEIECCLQIPDFLVPSNSLNILRQDDNLKWSIEGCDVSLKMSRSCHLFFFLYKYLASYFVLLCCLLLGFVLLCHFRGDRCGGIWTSKSNWRTKFQFSN